jgi:hypothetical protein
MNKKLLDEFLSEDADAYSRQRLFEAIREQRTSGAPIVREYTFNRFNVTLDFGTKEVTLEDDLAVGPQGEYKLSVEEFEKALRERK